MVTFLVTLVQTSLVPRLSRARTKSGKERGEPGKIYHVTNVIGIEELDHIIDNRPTEKGLETRNFWQFPIPVRVTIT